MPSFHDQRQVYHPENATETQEVERIGKAGSVLGSALGARDLVRIRKDQGLFPRASQVRFIFQTRLQQLTDVCNPSKPTA